MQQITRILLTWLAATGVAAAVEGSPGPARSRLEVFSAGLETFSAEFTQTVTAQDGRVESHGEGEVWLQRPGLFRWSYGGDFPELIVADGERVWLYDPTLEQVTVRRESGASEDSPLLLLTDPGAIERQFVIIEAGQIDGVDLLALESLHAESEFERVMLGFDREGLVLMQLEDAFGLRTDIRFTDVQRNPGLDPELFRFVPPEGTDVVGDLSADQSE